MKKSLPFLFLLTFAQVNAQCNYRLTSSYNNSSKQISVNGMFFRDLANGLATYKPNKYSGITAIYQSSFSVYGKDNNGQDHLSVTTFDGSDFSCGPIATDYSNTNYSNGFSNSIWSVYKFEVDQHIQNWNTAGYVIPPSIIHWPGNGDVSNGMMNEFAPYADVNGNGTYDPENGDYPDILGDQAYFLVLNDQNNNQFAGTLPLNIELHVLFYEFVSTDALNSTTFVNVKVFNRSTETYSDFRFNVFNDFDLGNYTDDFCGVDELRKMVYVYNGDPVDESTPVNAGYGTNPPAIGMVSLNHPLSSSVFPGDTILPNANNEYLQVIMGKNPDGTAITNGSIPTVFQYSDTLNTGYNEVALNHTPGDRRTFSSVSLGTLAPNSVKCLDFAWIYARNAGETSLFNSVDSLMKVADFIQDFYDHYAPCTDGTLQVQEVKAGTFKLYPNPSNGQLNCISGQNMDLIEVWNTDGKLIRSFQDQGKETQLDLEQLPAGFYLVKIGSGGEIHVVPFFKQ